jgi:hypothetical protein
MRRFYFHLKTAGGKLVSDDEGLELPDLNEAKREALQGARDLLVEAIKFGEPKVPEAFVIADETGRTLHVLPLTEVLPEPLKK